MSRLDGFLAYAESHRLTVSVLSGALIALIAWVDWLSPRTSFGFLYLVPLLLSAAAWNGYQILVVAALCGYLREVFDPLQMTAPRWNLLEAFNPSRWVLGSFERLAVSVAGFATTGFFVAQLNQRRRTYAEHLRESQEQMRLRREAERQLQILIETSPLAILTLDGRGRVLLANQSAQQLLGFGEEPLRGEPVAAYLPTLARMVPGQRAATQIRTHVECKGQRRNGEVFLANAWLSTWLSPGQSTDSNLDAPRLAAVIWDASENLRDREGAGLDSMMATSRVLVGAVAHEVRNLASAAASAHAGLAGLGGVQEDTHYQALGSLIHGLEKIASTGLRMASGRERAVTDLGTVLDEARIVIEPSLREAGIEVRWEVADGLPLVQADQQGLLQVLINLARNSRQALQDRPLRQVCISAALQDDLAVIRFCDNGPGVARPEELFRPFQPGARTSGLGLYVSRAILRSHGGGLRYEPLETGSCFAVELWPVEDPGGLS